MLRRLRYKRIATNLSRPNSNGYSFKREGPLRTDIHQCHPNALARYPTVTDVGTKRTASINEVNT